MTADGRFRRNNTDEKPGPHGEFYITAPFRMQSGVKLQESRSAFTHEYNYSRKTGVVESDYRAVPISKSTTSQNVFQRLEQRVGPSSTEETRTVIALRWSATT